MKKLVYIGLISTLVLSGCRNDSPAVPVEQTRSAANEDVPTIAESKKIEISNNQVITPSAEESIADVLLKDDDEKSYPYPLTNCYSSYQEVLSSNFPQYTLSDIALDTYGTSNFYSFNLNVGGKHSQPEVSFCDEEASFRISLPNEISNDILKDVIVCTIMTTGKDIDKTYASELMQNLVNSFDGSDISDVISTTNYKFYISPGSELYLRYLKVISISEINPPIKKGDYAQASNDLFNGELNTGSKIYIEGNILGNYAFDNYWVLEIKNASGTYVVYYDFDRFIDCFEIGDTYTFYGEIVKMRKGYEGCLRLDFYSNREL